MAQYNCVIVTMQVLTSLENHRNNDVYYETCTLIVCMNHFTFEGRVGKFASVVIFYDLIFNHFFENHSFALHAMHFFFFCKSFVGICFGAFPLPTSSTKKNFVITLSKKLRIPRLLDNVKAKFMISNSTDT